MSAFKTIWIVAILALLAQGASAACGGSLSSYLARNDLDGPIEYLYVVTPYSAISAAGSQFAVVFNGTDGGSIFSFLISGQTANITLTDSTASIPSNSPDAPRPRRPVSTAERSTSLPTTVLSLVVGLGVTQYFRKGFKSLFVLIVVLSMVNIITSRTFSEAPCPEAQVTLHLPLATVRFVCVNDEPCVCGPGFTGNGCTANTPTAAPVSTPSSPPVSPSCTDATKNGLETDVDCGGGACPQCLPGNTCLDNTDCSSKLCTDGLCTQPSCSDTVKNGDETDKDCGGTCPNNCTPGQLCSVPEDCTSAICTDGVCAQPTCSDAVQNDVETDVDCGGGKCVKCLPGDSCLADSDCNSGVCSGSLTCAEPSCSDTKLNGNETDVDCGGSCSNKCGNGQSCRGNSDCTSDYCTVAGICAQPTCSDNVQNGNESDKDCGGTCPPCLTGSKCKIGSDCSNVRCTNNICAEPSCDDNLKNGVETDVDCGGGTCSGCINGQKCISSTDCQSGFCSGTTCATPS